MTRILCVGIINIMHVSDQETPKRRPVNLTIREDILQEAKLLKLNASKAAEAGLLNAVREARAQEWLNANQAALQAHNERVAEEGPLLKPNWVSE